MSPEGAEARDQSGELAGYNLFSSDSALTECTGPAATFGTLPRGLDTEALMGRAFLKP